MSAIQSTYKSKDTEETLDKLFYRPLGYRAALAAKALKMTPNGVTITSIFTGIIAGFCFYFTNPIVIGVGIFLLLFSEMLDSADGQLARMTGVYSKVGRILDGMATSIMYLSVYVFLSLRLINQGFPWWIAIIAIVSGISHSTQCNYSDYFRNCYLEYSDRDAHGELRASNKIDEDRKTANTLFEKVMLRFYSNYAKSQESLTRNYSRLLNALEMVGKSRIPDEFFKYYKQLNKPNIKYYNILTANTRMFALILALIFNYPIAYFAFEIIVLNILLIYVVGKQNKIANKLIQII